MEFYENKFYQSIYNFEETGYGARRKAYHVFINDIQFPVPPTQITTTINNKNETIDLSNGGELNIVKAPGLTEISMDLILPRWYQVPYMVGFDRRKGFNTQADYLNFLELLKGQKRNKPFELAVLKPDAEVYNGNSILEYCTLEDYEILEDGANGVDIIVSLKFKKYIFPEIIKLEITKENEEVLTVEEKEEEIEKDVGKPNIPESYTVKKGDTLSAICMSILGDSNRYQEIAKINGISNPHLIYPGQVLKFG